MRSPDTVFTSLVLAIHGETLAERERAEAAEKRCGDLERRLSESLAREAAWAERARKT